MQLRVGMVTTDSPDPLPLAQWWADLLGGTVNDDSNGWFVVVKSPTTTLAFQRVDDPTAGKNRVHLDLFTDDLAAAVVTARSAGARQVAELEEGGVHWFTFADPEGNLFDVAQA